MKALYPGKANLCSGLPPTLGAIPNLTQKKGMTRTVRFWKNADLLTKKLSDQVRPQMWPIQARDFWSRAEFCA